MAGSKQKPPSCVHMQRTILQSKQKQLTTPCFLDLWQLCDLTLSVSCHAARHPAILENQNGPKVTNILKTAD
eukprot:3058624-Amphidinium_carterae.1